MADTKWYRLWIVRGNMVVQPALSGVYCEKQANSFLDGFNSESERNGSGYRAIKHEVRVVYEGDLKHGDAVPC